MAKDINHRRAAHLEVRGQLDDNAEARIFRSDEVHLVGVSPLYAATRNT